MDSSSFIQFDVPEYSNTVLSQLNELRLQGKLCDIIVHIQGQPFRAHKAVLAASSPYFRDHSALSTMSGLSISVIKNPNVFEQLLSFCYTGRMSLQLKDVVSFLTAASFLQMQCVIDKCTQILESIHSKINVGDVDSVTVGAEENSENRNGVKDSSYFANPIEISPPYCSQVRQSTTSSDLRMEATPGKSLRSRLQEEGHSDRGSSGSISEYEIQIEGDHEQGDLIVRESQIAEVKVKMEKSDRPSCSDSSSLGDDGYHTEMVDGEQVVAVNVGSYGSVLQHVYSFTHASSQATGVSETFGNLSNSSPSRSMLSCFRGGRARQKRISTGHLHSDVQGLLQGTDGDSMGTLNQHLRKNHPGVTEVRNRMESPDRTEAFVEQKVDNDASASEAMDSSMEVHAMSNTSD
ncbi:zinc finger and BTB domain-containing protein 34 isoform X1 [Lagopus leucura]|uniref:zinc finger and BTB domain-containing protein 34 isoform X1 n=1 Tax=Lagopus leucura TaxID=30410 RepID=UPI001C67CF0B|nr:zinc finger and BTB domain-containing protein 34 isoform X1 [Lagopus leucura]